MLFQLVRSGEGRAVDAGQHLVLLAATPIGPRDGEQFEVAQPGRVGDVGPPAQVHVVPLPIERDARDIQVRNQLHLIGITAVPEEPKRLVPPHLHPIDPLRRTREAAHLRLDGGQVLLRDRPGDVHVVVEAVLDARPDPKMRSRIEVLDGLGHQVRAGVAEDGEPILRARQNGLERPPDRDLPLQVQQFAVQLPGQSLLPLPQPGQGLGHLDRTPVELADPAVVSLKAQHNPFPPKILKNKKRPRCLHKHGDDVGALVSRFHSISGMAAQRPPALEPAVWGGAPTPYPDVRPRHPLGGGLRLVRRGETLSQWLRLSVHLILGAGNALRQGYSSSSSRFIQYRRCVTGYHQMRFSTRGWRHPLYNAPRAGAIYGRQDKGEDSGTRQGNQREAPALPPLLDMSGSGCGHPASCFSASITMTAVVTARPSPSWGFE